MQKGGKKEKRLIQPKKNETRDQFETLINKASGTKNGTENKRAKNTK